MNFDDTYATGKGHFQINVTAFFTGNSSKNENLWYWF